MGPLGGIHAALTNCIAERAFVVGCDMPTLNSLLVRELCTMPAEIEVVIPETPGGLEPLHAVYSRKCLPKMEQMLSTGERRILSFFELAQIRLVPRNRVSCLDPDFASFRNINTPEEYNALARDGEAP
jgi:FdhD protein